MRYNLKKFFWYFIFVQTSPIWGFWYINFLARLVNRCFTYNGYIIKHADYNLKSDSKYNSDEEMNELTYTKFEKLLANSNYDYWILLFGLGYTYLYKPFLATIYVCDHVIKKGFN
jgi:hypothetical protein